MRAVLALSLALAGPAFAQTEEGADEVELRPAPDWYAEAIVNLTTAQQLAQFCPTVTLDPALVQGASTDIMARLMSEGFDVSRSDGGMLPSPEKFTALQQSFLERNGMDGDAITQEMVCAAADAEIAAVSGIGFYLIEAPE